MAGAIRLLLFSGLALLAAESAAAEQPAVDPDFFLPQLQAHADPAVRDLAAQWAACRQMRPWTSADGAKTVQAAYLSHDAAGIRVQTPDGKTPTWPVGLFSAADQQFLARAAALRASIGTAVERLRQGEGGGGQAPKPAAAAAAAPGPNGLADLIARVEPAIVTITTDQGQGSGFVVDAGGLIVTNYHVIDGATSAMVKLKSGAEFPVTGYAAVQPGKDLALLRIQPAGPLPFLAVAGEVPVKGTSVAAFGAPKGFDFSVSNGIVAAVRTGREIDAALPGRGYDKDATWVQSTAPISPGNSGGPLVDDRGRVIGVNTWCRPDGQNLNFAIACTHIGQLVGQAGPHARALATLPRVPRAESLVLDNGFRIVFPSGAVLTDKTFAIDEDALRLWAAQAAGADESQLATLTHLNGAVSALASHTSGALHGMVFSFYEDGARRLWARYENGRHDGILLAQDPRGERTLWAQYQNGSRSGLCCFFKNDELRLVLECRGGKTTAVHLISGGRVEKSFPSELNAMGHDAARAALLEMQKADQDIIAVEKDLKQQVNEFDLALRRERAAVLNAEKRAAIQARINARGEARMNTIHSLRRQSGI